MSGSSAEWYNFGVHTIRNISSPEDLDNDRKVIVGQAPLTSFLGLPTDENVREYLLDAKGRQRKVMTQVHKAIQDTLLNNSDNFSVLNSGITLVARDSELDEKKKYLKLLNPSIINGSQTQGVIKDTIQDLEETDLLNGVHVKYELIITQDEELIAQTSIARNFQNDVASISIAGRLKQLDELEASLKQKLPGSKLRKSETDLSDDFVRTERLLQVIAALVPEELSMKSEFNKVYTYSQKTRCLKEFQRIYVGAHNPEDSQYEGYKKLYQFYLDVPAQAEELYNKWKTHQGFIGTGLKSIVRNNRKVEEVPDGIVFPILASLSAFATQVDGEWTIKMPKVLSDDDLIKVAARAYMEIARSNPTKMGKTKACYSALYEITSIYKRLIFST